MTLADRHRVLLVGWNLAGWEALTPLLDSGRLPHLAGLIERGVMGKLVTCGPLVAPTIFTSLATGMSADRHGILGPVEVTPDNTVQPVGPGPRRAPCFWETLSANDRRCHVVSFPTLSPAEDIRGTFVGPALFRRPPANGDEPFGPDGDSVRPAEDLPALKDLVVRLDEIDSDTLSTFVPYLIELAPRDPDLMAIRRALAAILSVHAVTTSLIERNDWSVLSVSYPALDGLWRRFGRYRPPRQADVDERRFGLFKSVLASAATLVDRLIGRMVELVDEQTVVLVCSARSVGSGASAQRQRSHQAGTSGPGLTGQGIFVMAGPDTRRDELIHDANLLDICPTVLHLTGLPVDADLDGKVLTEAFAQPQEVAVGGPSQAPPGEVLAELNAAAPWISDRRLNSALKHRPARRARIETAWILAESLLAGPRRPQAWPLLIRLYHTDPLRVDKAVAVAEALYVAGYVGDALDVMGPLARTFPGTAIGIFMAGMLALHRGDAYTALDRFEEATRDDPPLPLLQFYLGQVCLQMDKRGRAIDAFRRCVELDPNTVGAYLGLAEALFRNGDCEESADAALSALSIQFTNANAHVLLGRALMKLDQADRAEQAFQLALQLAPEGSPAWRYLTAKAPIPLDLELLHQPTAAPAGDDDVTAACRDIAEWQGRYVDDLARADRRLDAYLTANAQARDRVWPGPTESAVPPPPPAIDESDWTVRPALVSDQPLLRQAFDDILDFPHEVEAFVMHPTGTDDHRGVVVVQTKDDSGASVDIRLRVGTKESAGTDAGATAFMQRKLLRTAIARAAAGGAGRLGCTTGQAEDQSGLADCLEALGFEAISHQTVWRMDTAAFRDRCLGLVDRYRRRKALPADVRVVGLGRAPYQRVDQFLRGFFSDGAAAAPHRQDARISRVMLQGDRIVAAFVGHRKGAETYVATRLGVLPDLRGLWVTPWLLGDGCRVGYELGCRTIEFFIDEARYPEFGKIARGMRAEQIDEAALHSLDLTAPWPGA